MSQNPISTEQIIQVMQGLPMDTLKQVSQATFHLGAALEKRGFCDVMAEEALDIAPEQGGGILSLSWLDINGTLLNAKGETHEQVLDGRYPILVGARSVHGIGMIVGYSASKLDPGLFEQIERRLDSLIHHDSLQTNTVPAGSNKVPPRL